ncbi:MAG: NAD(P)-dependent oxidoreductase [Burkholderiaceae bacterium]|nr:NAD(P)-dependent oxidoreductase [Burkholderiaceae bacterium]
MATHHIGLVGVGLMGHGIATNLQKGGHRLTLLEHPGNQPLDALRAAGARTAATVPELARAVDVLLLCVTGSPQVEAVLTGEDGALAHLAPGSLVIDCSTAVPASTERMAAAAQARGLHFLDAPMTRTPKEAAEGRLNLLVGGDAALFAQWRPVLACFAENITHVGPAGAGHRMKLLHNYVSLGTVALLAEAAACAQRAGMAPEVFVDVLAKGGGAGVALERLRGAITTGDPSALRFAMSNAQKDLTYYQQMAADTGAVRDIGAAVLDTYAQAVQDGGGDRLVPELVAQLARRGG